MTRMTKPQLKRAIADLDAGVRSDFRGTTAQLPVLLPLIEHDLSLPENLSVRLADNDAFYADLDLPSREALWALERRLDQIDQLSYIAKGRVLREAKALLVKEEGHGRWGHWLNMRRLKATTARAHIRAANWYDESAIIAVLPPGAIYRGANAPDEVKQEIEKRARNGEVITIDTVLEAIQDDKKRKARFPEKLEKKRDKEQRRQRRQELEAKKLRDAYARRDAEQLVIAVQLIEDLRMVLGDAGTRKVLTLLGQTTICSLEKAFRDAA